SGCEQAGQENRTGGRKGAEAVSYSEFVREAPAVFASRAKAVTGAASGALRIGEPNDAYEQEADQVANDVMAGGGLRRPWPLAKPRGETSLQRKCSCGQSGGSGGECERCKQKEEERMLQRKAAGPAKSSLAPPIVGEVLSLPSRPLDKATRDF